MQSKRVIGASGLALTALVVVLSGWAFMGERRAYAAVRTNSDEAFAFLRRLEGDVPIGLSQLSQERALEMCSEALIAPISFAFPPEEKQAVARRCAAMAERVLERAPTWGLAWFSFARAQFEHGATEPAAQSLVTSQRLAPNEGWVAQKRILLVRDFRRSTAPEASDLDALLRRDLATLFTSSETIRWVADLYSVAPDMADVITDVAEDQGDRERAILLSRVRSNAQNGRR